LTLLATGAELRRTGEGTVGAVVCVNGGQARDVEGTWSASLEWLVRRVAPRFPELSFAEVRYRVKSWRRLEWCVEDALAAIAEVGTRTLIVGFSMGGAVGIATAGEPAVEGVVGLAPWIPDQLDVSPLSGKRIVVVHGTLDRPLPGIPGVSPGLSRRGVERARAAGATASYVLVQGGVHGLALRAPWGALLTLPRAARWVEAVEEELRRFAAG